MNPELKKLLRNLSPEYRPLAKALFDKGFRPWHQIVDSLLIVDVLAPIESVNEVGSYVAQLKSCFSDWGYPSIESLVYSIHVVESGPDTTARIEIDGVDFDKFGNLPPLEQDLSFTPEQIRAAAIAGMTAASSYRIVNGLPALEAHRFTDENVAHWCEVVKGVLDRDPPGDRLEEIFHATVLDVLDVDFVE